MFELCSTISDTASYQENPGILHLWQPKQPIYFPAFQDITTFSQSYSFSGFQGDYSGELGETAAASAWERVSEIRSTDHRKSSKN
jgi:hypothetical protein